LGELDGPREVGEGPLPPGVAEDLEDGEGASDRLGSAGHGPARNRGMLFHNVDYTSANRAPRQDPAARHWRRPAGRATLRPRCAPISSTSSSASAGWAAP